MTLKTKIAFQGQSIILSIELAFDSAQGVYCQLWETFEAPPPGATWNTPFLKTFDVHYLPADDLIEFAVELTKFIKRAVKCNKEFMESQYLERYMA